MTTVTVWLLIAVSMGYYNKGTVTTVGKFETAQDCEAVRRKIPDEATTLCVQAKLVK